ncbi:MAG: hypothetical protein BGO67_06605 [Alphaproteobacteria bacterium 41-28]|nr:MAG: hypothetical protein BGO67_06605 [Alphaproteobacteria bacterium 41-28]
MKKVSLFAFLLATGTSVGVTAASAETLVPGCPKAFQGFGIRGIIGYTVGFAKERTRIVNEDSGVAAFSRSDIGFRGLNGGLGVDYTHRLCNWAIGIGFDALWSNTNGKHRSRVFDEDSGEVISFNHTKTRLRNSLQLFGRLGYVIGGQVMPFVGLGWDNSAWKQKASFADSDGDHFRTHKRKRINSFLWKFGVDFLATKHCIIGAEYTGTAGGRLRAHKSFVEDDVTVKSHSRPQNNTFALTFKVIY